MPSTTSSFSEVNASAITKLIVKLYEQVGLSLPGETKRYITPLGELLGSFNLTWHEISNLSSQAASDFLVQQGGRLESLAEIDDVALAGFLYAGLHYGSIFVERNDPLTRRRFSAAHELGHYLLHFRPMLQAISDQGWDESQPMELTEKLVEPEPELE